ncbi:MAG: hypothetical protein LBE92_09660 [Chryseobacterium sp.]|jgi:hypothetical protein|uniref:hypothetical protein n=1 Tax=Chryseobacterium sp. TaxID=1871047 RepID=UPI0028288D77|nr:hypothetical protein [Chryseobacterium sp.]MDR2236379.1 hypothetical protein [Chryseobacterium sp.]
MKIKLNDKFLALALAFCFSLCFGQKTEFTVPENIENLQYSIFNFSNDFTKDNVKSAASSDKDFFTSVDLYNLKDEAGKKNPYLILALKNGAKPKQFIQHAAWNITMKKLSSKSTKVSISLQEVVPDSWSRKDVDVKQTKSTGLLEKEIKEFLLSGEGKAAKVSEATEAAAEATMAAATEVAEAAEAAVAVEDTEYIADAPPKKKTVSKKLQNLFNKKQFISLPASEAAFTNLLKIKASQVACESCKNGKQSSWDFDDFNLIYGHMTDGTEYYGLQYYGDNMVSGLPYGLVFNGSSASECRDKFARYNAQLYQTSVEVDENTSSALTVVTFKMNSSFVRLEFGNTYLTRVLISTKEF